MTALSSQKERERATNALGDAPHSCGFCRLLDDGPAVSDSWAVVAETEDFVAVPSLGALVPGWLLIVPRWHVLSLATMTPVEHERLESWLGEMLPLWESHFGPVSLFEHGPSSPGAPPGCGVDHAHLHVVPTAGIDLREAAGRRMPQLTWAPITSLKATASRLGHGDDYLYLQVEDGSRWIATGDVPSQALRRVFAAELDRPSDFDWRCNPELDVVRATIERARRPA